MQVNEKIFEVDRIVCRREHKGKEEYLVYWKGFELSSATWEPVDNLLSCTDIIEQFQRQNSPIPGANPFSLVRTQKTKKVHVKMLLTRKNKQKRTKSMAGLDKDDNENFMNSSLPLNINKRKLSEGEKLIRDTLLHESKTMVPEKTSLNNINNIFINGFQNNLDHKVNGYSMKRVLNRSNRLRDTNDEKLVLSHVERGYMNITLNNTTRHNVLTIGMFESLRDIMIKAKKSSDVKAVLLSNNGDYFCSGIDYAELIECCDEKEYKILVNDLVSSISNFMEIFLSFNKPIVCAINGPALEFGVSLAVASDFAYASSKASFDLMFNKIALTPIGCVTQLLPRVVGNGMANSMLYIGGRYTAVSAYDRGLVLDVYGVNSFQEDMQKKMTQLTAHSNHVLESTKKIVKYFELARLKEVCSEELRVYEQYLCCKDSRKKIKDDWTMLINLFGDV